MAFKNFAYSTVLTAPSPATSGTSLVVQSADGAKFPTVPFNATVWPAGTQPSTTNAEIVRVTTISTDTFTITRTQESTSARSIVVGDQIAATITEASLYFNPYCFRAYDSGGTTLTDGSEVQINLATEEYDYNSNFTASTYTAPVAGVYHFSGAVQITGAIASPVFFQARIYKNTSTRIIDGWRGSPDSNNAASVVASDILLAAGDTIILKAVQDSGGNEATVADSISTFLSGHLVHRT